METTLTELFQAMSTKDEGKFKVDNVEIEWRRWNDRCGSTYVTDKAGTTIALSFFEGIEMFMEKLGD